MQARCTTMVIFMVWNLEAFLSTQLPMAGESRSVTPFVSTPLMDVGSKVSGYAAAKRRI